MKSIYLFLYMFLLSFTTLGQTVPYLSLDTVLSRIENNYPLLLSYQYNIEALNARVEGTRAWMPPTITAGIMRFPYDLELVKMKDDPMNQAGFGVSFEQMIPNRHKLDSKTAYANSLASIQESKRNWTKNDLRKEAKLLYYYRYVAERKLLVIEENTNLLNMLVTLTEARFSSNQSQLQTLFKAKARLAELKNMQLMFLSAISESTIGLNTLMVEQTHTQFEIDSTINPKRYRLVLNDTSGISSRSDIESMGRSIEAMRLEQQIMKNGTRPDFGVKAEHMQMLGMPSQWSLMGMLSLPVPWSTKMYKSEVKAIDFQIQAMKTDIQTMELMAKRMAAEKLVMLNNEISQYDLYEKEILPAYTNNYKVNLLAYEQNTGELFILLDAWEMLLMKQLEQYDLLFTILKLEAEYEYEKEIR